MAETVPHRGLDAQGRIAREGSLARVQHEFRPVVAAARDAVLGLFGARLHSAYLYGSIPRGTARVGRSDLDLLIVPRADPSPADWDAVRDLGERLDEEFPEIDGAGALLYGRDRLLSDAETYDMGFFVACLCTPLLGDDLAEYLPGYRPDSRLARETNGDLGTLLPHWRTRAQEATDPGARVRLVRHQSRHLVRTAFTLVMPRWNGWTSDLHEMAEAFAEYYPARGDQVRAAAVRGYEPTDSPEALAQYTDDLGPWLAQEYARVHGVKSPRP
ncbi:nucleotidyltransferase [Streptomyces niveiscabiei]|uniref:nucleotidyltransferase domain-containing protein n=1 Tax=Streptomyces niveiscabiei TaxID=164115 RepID=UPI0006EB2B88|nr:nucleotidyltransferase domain-containing protein [Streptomyces niveiscabiei]